MSKNIRQIVIAPHITEKGSNLQLRTDCNKYVFQVSLRANKIEIKKAIEKIFEVSVTCVNTIRLQGKKKSMGRYVGKRPDWKKAIVTLKAGDSIPDFEM